MPWCVLLTPPPSPQSFFSGPVCGLCDPKNGKITVNNLLHWAAVLIRLTNARYVCAHTRVHEHIPECLTCYKRSQQLL